MQLKANLRRPGLDASSKLFLLFFGVAVALRVLLCWVNPPANAFDNHFEPILMIMRSGVIPAKDACFQCYQPPVFYWISAMIGTAALHLGVTLANVIKLLQFVSCFYGILTVAVCYLILKKFPLSNFSRLLAFGTVCFLPRHIYMCAMNSNDTLSYLFVALSVYLVILALERQLAPKILALLTVVLTISLFTKYTTFAVIPAVLAAFLTACFGQPVASRKKTAIAFLAVMVLPLVMLSAYFISNVRQYHSPLPWNLSRYDPSVYRPRDEGGINFVSFKPWEKINDPMLVPGQLHSFWTLIYSGMWFDTEPYFLPFLDSNRDWWRHYHAWYVGQGFFPGQNRSLSPLAVLCGGGLMVLGLFPLGLVLAGLYCYVPGRWQRLFQLSPARRAALNLFPVLLAFNVAGVIALTLRLPVYSTMKPSYLLESTPSLMMFLALGIMLCEKSVFLKRMVLISFGAIFALATLHILHIVLAVVSLESH